MKRSLSLLLAVFMVLSLAFVGVVSATADVPDGFTGINSLSQITDPAGSYYLTADIGDAENPNTTTFESFSGTIDGGNRTIYTSVPLVATLDGATIKNVTIKGSVSVTATSNYVPNGVIAKVAIKTVTFSNVTNEADITGTNSGGNNVLGGFIGDLGKDSSNLGNAVFTNCINKGTITGTATANHLLLGGFIGRTIGQNSYGNNATTFTNCRNSGAILGDVPSSHANNGIIGGYIGYAQAKSGGYTFTDCTNTASVSCGGTGGGKKAGGFIGVMEATTASLTNCVNSGEINNASTVGGFFADVQRNVTIDKCFNIGTIIENQPNDASINTMAGGFIGFVRGSCKLTVTKSANYGDVSSYSNRSGAVTTAGGIVGCYDSAATATAMTDVANYGAISSTRKKDDGTDTYIAGGIVGVYKVITGTFTRCLSVGSLTGSDYYGNAIIGSSNNMSNTDSSKMITLTDCYGRHPRAVGYYIESNTDSKGNLKFVYTGVGEQTVIGGTDTTSVSGAWNIINLYNTYYTSSGVITAANAQGVNAAKKLGGFDFGSGTWILREGYPELAVAETLLGTSEKPAGEYTVNLEGQQQSLAVGETYALRFVSSVTSTAYDYVGVEVLVATSGNATVKTAGEKKSASVWEQILASADGVNSAYPAEPVDGTYYSALTLTDIPTTGTYTFIVTPYTEKDGAKTNGATAAIVYKDGALATSYWFAAPAR